MESKSLVGELVLGLIFMFTGIIFYFNSLNISVLNLGLLGPQLFPVISSASLAFLSFILVVRNLLVIVRKNNFKAFTLNLPRFDKENIKGTIYTLIIIVMVIVYAYLLNIIGFLLTTMLLTGILAKLLKAKNEEAVLLSIIFSLLLYILFKLILKVPLPGGVLGW